MSIIKTIGIICEYNPFHNGHLYQINKIKEKYPDSLIIALVSGPFAQRGEASILTKWDKTIICLENRIDMVVELPFIFATQGADIFAMGALKILNMLKIDILVFGFEQYNKENLVLFAKTQLYNKNYSSLVKIYLDKGINYPTALSKAMYDINGFTIDKPNDLLGLAYIREIIKNNYGIETFLIKRTNDYHGKNIDSDIISASLIRDLFYEGKDISRFVPLITLKYLKRINYDLYFQLLKYQLTINSTSLSVYQTVDEGIENRINKYFRDSYSLNELIMNIKCKRYTYNKISRMFTHILCGYKKGGNITDINYINVLGFNELGRLYLNSIKKNVHILAGKEYNEFDQKASYIYSLLLTGDDQILYINNEKANKPIIK